MYMYLYTCMHMWMYIHTHSICTHAYTRAQLHTSGLEKLVHDALTYTHVQRHFCDTRATCAHHYIDIDTMDIHSVTFVEDVSLACVFSAKEPYKRDYTLQKRPVYVPRRCSTRVCHYIDMGWLWLVCSLKLWVSFAESRLFYRALLQKGLIISRSRLSVATLYIDTALI